MEKKEENDMKMMTWNLSLIGTKKIDHWILVWLWEKKRFDGSRKKVYGSGSVVTRERDEVIWYVLV